LRLLHERLGRPERTANLQALDELFQGPIATTLDNELVPFLPADDRTDGKNVYPWGIARDEIEAFLDERPERRNEILGLHTVVRRTKPAALRRDLAVLRRHPVLDTLHPGLATHLGDLAEHLEREPLYAVPYSVAWPGVMLDAHARLWDAADAVAADEPDTAAFLRQRARDLLTDDNEAGDAAWVRGEVGRLDAVIGAYEVYDDDLFGAKAFFGASLFIRHDATTTLIRQSLEHLREIDHLLPDHRERHIQTDIPAGSYEIVAATGQGVGVGAEILPNDADLSRKYGRKILGRHNLFVHPASFERLEARWRAVMVREHHADLTPMGSYLQAMWHEIGHHLGPRFDHRGRALEAALEAEASPMEELKAELASQLVASHLETVGLLDADATRGIGAAGILAGLRPVRPLRHQVYPTLWLMQVNYYLEQGMLLYEDGNLAIRWERHVEVVRSMLGEVLEIQHAGDRGRAAAFIERYSGWDARNEAIARELKAVERYRFTLFRFPRLGRGAAS
jgi:hypothetical protein